MKEQIKELRVRVDGLAQLTKELKPCKISYGVDPTYKLGNSKEIEKAVDSLYLAKAWLGKVLGELGESTPYANDGNRKTIDDIEPTADKGHIVVFEDFNHIEKVDWLRQEINKVLVETQSKLNFIKQQKISYDSLNYIDLYQKNIYTHLSEARFWLGFELERIRESSTYNI